MFNADRLIIARMRKCLTKKALAEKVGVTPATITRLELGKNEPEAATVDNLVHALGFPKDFFYGGDLDRIDPKAVSFRGLTTMKAKERNAAIAAGEIAYLLLDWVEQKFNLPTPDLIDLSHEADPNVAARYLRQYWGLGDAPISNMIRLLESKGVRVLSLSENNRNVDAFSCNRGGTPYVFLNTFKTPEHSRFDAAHELGHLVMHKHAGPRNDRAAERDADQFASAFLMPELDVIARTPRNPSIEKLVVAKKRWGVSLSALAYRTHKLKMLSDWHYRGICISVNKRFGRSEPESMPREESVVWQKVFGELWKERVTKSHIANELSIPLEELESLVFGLIGADNGSDDGKRAGSFLRLVK